MGENHIEREDEGEEFTFEKAEDREGEVPQHDTTNDDDYKKNTENESDTRPAGEGVRKTRFEDIPQPRRDLTMTAFMFTVVGVFQNREMTPMIPATIMMAVSTHPKTP